MLSENQERFICYGKFGSPCVGDWDEVMLAIIKEFIYFAEDGTDQNMTIEIERTED